MSSSVPRPCPVRFSELGMSLALAWLLALTAAAQAEDWTQYRGPMHDGISTETGIAKAWGDGAAQSPLENPNR